MGRIGIVVFGIYAKNQAQASLVSTPILLILTSTPVLCIFNEDLANILNYTYGGVLANLAESLTIGTKYQWNVMDTAVLIAWLVSLSLFITRIRKMESTINNGEV